MGKKSFAILFVAVVAIFASYNIYQSQRVGTMSDLALANVEALANDDEGDFEIVCNGTKNTPPGACWHTYGECADGWFIRWDDCRFSGSMSDRCLTPCD